MQDELRPLRKGLSYQDDTCEVVGTSLVIVALFGFY